MATLQGAIDQIQAVVGAVSGIRKAPDEPPDQMNVFPFAVSYARDGDYFIGPPMVMTGLHTLVVEVHVARKDLARDVASAMAFAKSIPNAIFSAYTSNTLTAIDTFAGIRYEFGALGWGGVETLGFRFYVYQVKTQDEVT